ncbi:MAG TPA: hypothetical protein VG276_26500 [Actinomycetes bacterium]|nr:hypothetical protein [Actinomycetes bacterium]
MPIANLERRLRELGRLRMGHRVDTGRKTKRGEPVTHPAKLETWRLTSPTRSLLDAAAARYGGTVTAWDGAPAGTGTQYELYTDAGALHVVVPPEHALTAWYEHWSGGGCQRRCDGTRELLGDGPCVCAEEFEAGGARVCKPTTRLNVLLPDLPGLGVWRLETHGYYAAVELDGMVAFLGHFAGMLPALLKIEQRIVKRPGEPPRHFGVPALELAVPLAEVAAQTGQSPFALTAPPRALPPPGVDGDTGEVTAGEFYRQHEAELESGPPGWEYPADDFAGGPAGGGAAPPPSPAAFRAELEAEQREGAGRRRHFEAAVAAQASGAGEREPASHAESADGEVAGDVRDDPAPDSVPPQPGADFPRAGGAATAVRVSDLAKACNRRIADARERLERAGFAGVTGASVLSGDALAAARKALASGGDGP